MASSCRKRAPTPACATRIVREGILMERKEMGGNNAPQEQNQAIAKQIKVLEHRLHRALVKFNEAIAANKDLREEIDNLRRERVVFDGIYKKLQHELAEKKKRMAEIIEVLTAPATFFLLRPGSTPHRDACNGDLTPPGPNRPPLQTGPHRLAPKAHGQGVHRRPVSSAGRPADFLKFALGPI